MNKPIAEDFEAIAAGMKRRTQEKAIAQYPWLAGCDYNPKQVPACTGCLDAGWIYTGSEPETMKDTFAPCPLCGNPKGFDAPNAQEDDGPLCGNCEGGGWVMGSTPSGIPCPKECPDCGNPKGHPSP